MLWLVPPIPWATAASFGAPVAGALMAACAISRAPSVALTDLDFPAGIFGWSAAGLVVATFSPKKKMMMMKRSPNRLLVGWGVVMMVMWSFGTIIFGLMDPGAPNMFSNVRMSGGTNHYFLPTGLLQRWYYDDPASVFGGGVLRVEASNSTVLNKIHPGEMTSLLSPETHRVLKDLGYVGRFFNSAVANIVGTHVMPPYDVRPKYTLPAFELHRVLRLDPDPVTITVTKLDGPTGDEHWRRSSGRRSATLVYAPSYPHLASCNLRQLNNNITTSCDDDNDLFHRTFLAAKAKANWLNFIGDNLLMWNSYVIFDEDPDATELHCYGS